MPRRTRRALRADILHTPHQPLGGWHRDQAAAAIFGNGSRQAANSLSRSCQRCTSGKLLDRNVRLLRIGQRHSDGEVGDRQDVAKQVCAAAQMIVQDMAVLQDIAGRFLRRGFARRAQIEDRLDDVLEVERAGVPREMLRVPAQPAQHFDLPVAARPKVRSRGPREIAHDRVRFPDPLLAVLEHRNLAVRIDRQERRLALFAVPQIDVDELDRRVEISCDRARLSRIERLGIVELHDAFSSDLRRTSLRACRASRSSRGCGRSWWLRRTAARAAASAACGCPRP